MQRSNLPNFPAIILTLILLFFYGCSTDPVGGTEVVNERIIARVSFADGAAAANTAVWAVQKTAVDSQITAVADDSGYVVFEGVSDTVYALSAIHSIYAGYTDNVMPGDSALIVIHNQGYLHLNVSDPEQYSKAQLESTPFYRPIDSTTVLFASLAQTHYQLLVRNPQGQVVIDTSVAVLSAETTYVSF